MNRQWPLARPTWIVDSTTTHWIVSHGPYGSFTWYLMDHTIAESGQVQEEVVPVLLHEPRHSVGNGARVVGEAEVAPYRKPLVALGPPGGVVLAVPEALSIEWFGVTEIWNRLTVKECGDF